MSGYSYFLPLILAVTVTLLVAVIVRYYLYYRRALGDSDDLSQKIDDLENEKQERLKMADALHRKQAWYRILFNNTNDIIFVHGITDKGLPGHFVAVNDVACAKLEHSRDQLLELTPLDIEVVETPYAVPRYTRAELVTLSDQEILERENTYARQLVKQILEAPQVFEREYITRQGTRIPVEVTAHAFDFLGQKMIMAVAGDITERKATERELRLSEQRFRDFFAHSPIGVALYDAQRQLVNVNRACLRMLGVPDKTEFSNFNVFDNPFISESVRELLSKGETARYEAALDFDEVKKRGLFTTTRMGIANLEIWVNNLGLDPDFKPKGYLIEIQDITKRRKVEAALLQSERQLRQSQKMQAIGTLSGGIAHDFNNILTPILGYSEMILHTVAEDDPIHAYVAEVLKASHRAKDLVNQILTFSRQTEQAGQVIRVIPIAKEVLRLLPASLPKGIEIRRSIAATHDIVLADPTQIHQVVMNLCTNAAHAMRESGGALELRLTNFLIDQKSRRNFPELEPGRYLRLSIKDSGTGMDQATVERIFEPFFTTKDKGEGTGMGLSVVHGIVTSLKGTITVDTELGEGATFHVILPTVEKTAETTPDVETPLPSGSECVLLVDDETEIVKMGAHMLASLGFRPVVANDGIEALRLFELNPEQFDIVITDQVMPGMTGAELTRKLKSVRPELPVILCTGFSEALTPEQAKETGVSEFMMKPIGMRQLAEAIKRALGDREPAEEVG